MADGRDVKVIRDWIAKQPHLPQNLGTYDKYAYITNMYS